MPDNGVIHQQGGEITPAVVTAMASRKGGDLEPAVKSSSGGLLSFLKSDLFSNISGLLQTGLSGLITGLQNRANRKWQERMTDIAYERQLSQWNRENAWNSPSAMVARLKAGGLNVNDAFSGQGAATAGGLSSVATPSYSPMDISSSMSSMIGSLSGLGNMFINKGNLGLNTARIGYLNALTAVQIQQVKSQVDNLAVDTAYKSVLLKYLDESERVRIDKDIASIQLTGAQRSYIEEQIKYYGPQIQSIINKNYADAENQRKGVDYMDELIKKVRNETEHELVKMGLTEKQAKYYGSQAITSMIYGGINSVANLGTAVSNFLPFSGGSSLPTNGYNYSVPSF